MVDCGDLASKTGMIFPHEAEVLHLYPYQSIQKQLKENTYLPSFFVLFPPQLVGIWSHLKTVIFQKNSNELYAKNNRNNLTSHPIYLIKPCIIDCTCGIRDACCPTLFIKLLSFVEYTCTKFVWNVHIEKDHQRCKYCQHATQCMAIKKCSSFVVQTKCRFPIHSLFQRAILVEIQTLSGKKRKKNMNRTERQCRRIAQKGSAEC